MAYIALYRKYRSQSFTELMGQEAVTTTLRNALKLGRIAHAYLFHGARGCGKTSTARLLARALNCIAQDGPTADPCGVCRLCVAIRDGICMDVVEMDAASETGIDDVREKIIENVQYAPAEARYKVYIIDEVHDLSAKAFDALLKTLEEPPPHVVFVLATTEIHKVPVTIGSRCQKYQFRRGTLQDLSASIQRVVTAEGLTADSEAVLSIARAAEGSWRDALSLLEQVIAYSDTHISADAVQRALGTVGSETLGRVMETVAQGDWNATLTIAGELIDSGKDVRQLLTGLQGYLRELMLISSGATMAAEQELGKERLSQLTPVAALFEPSTLLAMSGVLAAAEKETRFSNQHRWLLERTLCMLQPESLQSSLQSPSVKPTSTATTRQARQPAALATEPVVIPRPPALAEVQAFASGPGDTNEGFAEEIDTAVEFTPPLFTEPARPINPPMPQPTAAVTGAPQSSAGADEISPSPDRFADDVTLTVIQRAWPRILKLVRQKSPAGAGFAEKARPVDLEGKIITLVFADTFSRDRIHTKGRELVESKINECLSSSGFKIRCIMEGEHGIQGQPGQMPPGSPPAAQGDNSEPTALTLLEAPIPDVVQAATRIADFELSPTPVEVSEYLTQPVDTGNATEVSTGRPVDENMIREKRVNAEEAGLVAETLNVFGGEVVHTEPV